MKYIPVILIIILNAYIGYGKVIAFHKVMPDPVYIFELSDAVRRIGLTPADGIITRRPHLSYYSHTKFVMAPTDRMDFEGLHRYARANNAKLIWIDGIVMNMNPIFLYMARNIQNYPGFTPILTRPEGVLYRVEMP